MSKRLLGFTVLMIGAAIVFATYILWTLSLAPPAPARPVPLRANVPTVNALAPAPPPFADYGAVVTKNLFSPDRSESMPTPAPVVVAPLPVVVKPVLHGVVMNEKTQTQRAYLEDPATKRVFGYTIGDPLAGGVVERIEAHRVVIRRPEGPLEVSLTDPAKPKVAVSPPPGPSTVPALAPGPVSRPEGGRPTRRPRSTMGTSNALTRAQ